MDTNKILKNAIAQSRLIKEASIAEVKKSFEEQFSPEIRSILSAKLNEMDDNSFDDDSMSENIDLASILAELEAEGESTLDEAKKEGDDDKKDDEPKDEPKDDKPKADAPKAPKKDDEPKDEEEVPVDDPEALKAYIANLVDEIIAEKEGGMGDDSMGNDDLDLDLDDDSAGAGDDMDMDFSLDDDKPKKDAGLEEDEFLFEFSEDDFGMGGMNDDYSGGHEDYMGGNDDDYSELYEAKKSNRILQKQLAESRSALNKINNELKESNLIKEKLELINKLFGLKNLSESQKLQIIGSFDKANSSKEAKLIYESLSNVMISKTNNNSKLGKNLGYASRPTGGKSSLNESQNSNIIDPTVARWAKLANIKK